MPKSYTKVIGGITNNCSITKTEYTFQSGF